MQAPPLNANRKQAYGKTFSLIEKVYSRRKETSKNKSNGSPLAPTGHIRAKTEELVQRLLESWAETSFQHQRIQMA
jgi:hypothetical protein